MNTYTPGPWAVNPDGRIVDQYGDTVTRYYDTPQPVAEEKANAQLMAAAPEMLVLLKWFSQKMTDDSVNNMEKFVTEMNLKADRIIAKAEGRK